MSEFVRASELYDVESRTPIAHPAHQATDADVRRALEEREIRADGGNTSSGTDRDKNNKWVRRAGSWLGQRSDGRLYREENLIHKRGVSLVAVTVIGHQLRAGGDSG